jgi:hypothetical protein
MRKQLTLKQFKSGTKFKFKDQQGKLSSETYYYKKFGFKDMDSIEVVVITDIKLSNDRWLEFERVTKSSFTVSNWMINKKVKSRIDLIDCVVV